jgi:hypothetical protein
VDVSTDIKRVLKAFAKHERITMSAVVETALRLYLDPH